MVMFCCAGGSLEIYGAIPEPVLGRISVAVSMQYFCNTICNDVFDYPSLSIRKCFIYFAHCVDCIIHFASRSKLKSMQEAHDFRRSLYVVFYYTWENQTSTRTSGNRSGMLVVKPPFPPPPQTRSVTSCARCVLECTLHKMAS